MNYSALILEDELIIALLLRRILENKGFTNIEVISDGDEAISAARKMNPDLIVMDWHLPDKNASEIISELKEALAEQLPPVLITSGDNIPQSKLQKLELDSVAFIPKPFTKKEICGHLQEFFKNLVLE